MSDRHKGEPHPTERIASFREFMLAEYGTDYRATDTTIMRHLATADRIIQDTGPADGGAFDRAARRIRAAVDGPS